MEVLNKTRIVTDDYVLILIIMEDTHGAQHAFLMCNIFRS